MLFENNERTDTKRRSPIESNYAYLNRAKGPIFSWTRDVIEGFLKKYPSEEKRRIINDLRSKEDGKFLSAFFEIYLYNLMIVLGASVIIHPTLESGEKPDFLVTFPNVAEFYLEAKLVYRPHNISRNEKLLNLLELEINKKFKGSTIFLEMHALEGQMNTNISFKKIANELFKWTKQLDKSTIIEAQENNRNKLEVITKHLKYNTWSIKFIARLLPDERKVEEQTILMRFFDPMWVDNSGLKSNISGKAKHYKEIDKPFILAINNACAWNIDYYDIFDVLLGQEVVTFYQGRSQTKFSRRKNGLWTKPNCQHTRISAIFFSAGLEPYNCNNKDIVLIHNPWATHKLPESPLHQLTHWLDLKKIAGVHPSVLFDFPEIPED